jgi:two-component system, NtrC family, sensor kinase
MKQRKNADGKPPKAGRRKQTSPKRSNTPKTARSNKSHAAPKETGVARLRRERDEALEQQAATAEVLQTINASPGNLAPVFDVILQKAHALCNVAYGSLQLCDGDTIRAVAMHGLSEGFANLLRQPRRIADAPYVQALLEGKRYVQIDDLRRQANSAILRASAEQEDGRTLLMVPLRKEGRLLGMIVSARPHEVTLFTEKEIGLLESFAAQAVIAIENARLFNETKEALERQTATADVLRVIASSPTDMQPVFDAIAERSNRLIGGYSTAVFRFIDDNMVELAAFTPIHPQADATFKASFPRPLRGLSSIYDLVRAGQSVQIGDTEHDPAIREIAQSRGFRSMLFTPLIGDRGAIGYISVTRKEPGTFADHHIQLLRTFADQAVIAIQNVKLFDEVQAKTRDLEESLQQQTATSDVLKVISSSPGELEPVFKAVLQNATRLCDAGFGTLLRYDGNAFYLAADVGTRPVLAEHLRRPGPFNFAPGGMVDRILTTRQLHHSADYAADAAPGFAATLGGARSTLGVPILKDDALYGALIIYRIEVRPFSEREIALVQSFAAQATIAIENARLINETKEALERQTATADILRVIASSPSDLQPVFDAIAERSNRLVDALSTTVFTLADGMMHLRAFTPTTPEADATLQATFPAPLSTFSWGESIRSGEIYRVIDSEHEPEGLRDLARRRGWRSCLCVPLLRDGKPIGMIGPTRAEPGPFTDHHVQLLQTFADQAVIAISNVGLFNEVQQRTRELSTSLDELRAAQDRLVQTEKLASLGQLTAGIAHEIKNPLNFVNNFSALSAELIEEMKGVLSDVSLDKNKREELDEITQMLKSNLEKVVQHGKRADSIVKNMLLHSRQGSGEHRPVDINAIVDESLNLAYHGARAEKTGFNIKIQRDFDPAVGMADVYPQEITRVLLNLISNGFYATAKRETQAGDGFEPTLSAATKNLGDKVEIRIRDNGTGIPEEVKEKIFNPFFTTKPAGEGTGLGLSMSHDIVVKQHGGTIDVGTTPGAFTEFRIVLPRAGAAVIKSGDRA